MPIPIISSIISMYKMPKKVPNSILFSIQPFSIKVKKQNAILKAQNALEGKTFEYHPKNPKPSPTSSMLDLEEGFYTKDGATIFIADGKRAIVFDANNGNIEYTNKSKLISVKSFFTKLQKVIDKYNNQKK